MVWGAFSVSGKAYLVVIDGNKTLLVISMSWKKVFAFMNRLNTNNAIFNRTTQPYPLLRSRNDWFKTKNTEFLDWPNRKFVGNFVKKSIQK